MLFQLFIVTALVNNIFGELCEKKWMHNKDENVCVKVIDGELGSYNDAVKYYSTVPDVLDLSQEIKNIDFTAIFWTDVLEPVEVDIPEEPVEVDIPEEPVPVEVDLPEDTNGKEDEPIIEPSAPPITLITGKNIYISGIPHADFSQFSLNLLCGPDITYDHALHLDLRNNFGNFKKVAILNTLENGRWGKKETESNDFPFSPETPFEMTLEIHQDTVQVTVNDKHYVDFKLRILPFDQDYYFEIHGDVTIYEIRYY